MSSLTFCQQSVIVDNLNFTHIRTKVPEQKRSYQIARFELKVIVFAFTITNPKHYLCQRNYKIKNDKQYW